MLTPDQWSVALANKIPEATATAIVTREVQAFLVQFRREEGYTSTEVGNAVVGQAGKDIRARFFRLLVNVRLALPDWAIEVGTKRYMGRTVPVYVWQAPHTAKLPEGATPVTCCPTCGSELF